MTVFEILEKKLRWRLGDLPKASPCAFPGPKLSNPDPKPTQTPNQPKSQALGPQTPSAETRNPKPWNPKPWDPKPWDPKKTKCAQRIFHVKGSVACGGFHERPGGTPTTLAARLRRNFLRVPVDPAHWAREGLEGDTSQVLGCSPHSSCQRYAKSVSQRHHEARTTCTVL